MLELHLCNDFDGPVFAPATGAEAGTLYAGPQKLLHWLEAQSGLSGLPHNTEYLRIELYRQALMQLQSEQTGRPHFFSGSMEADRYATAQALLAWRDELLLAGWNFDVPPDAPHRLQDLAAVEQIFLKKIQAPEHLRIAQGYADRFDAVLHNASHRPPDISTVFLHEPENFYPPHFQRLFKLWLSQGVSFRTCAPGTPAPAESDLGRLQKSLAGQKQDKKAPAADGSLLVLKARRDSDAAPWLAHLLKENPHFRPLLLAPEMNRTLEQSMLSAGLPPTGILSASLARPSLQVLKLAPAFLWEPVDVFKIMEFVTLPLKPIDDGLAMTIARVLAEKPGLFSDKWFAAVYGYLESEGVEAAAAEQYAFWFNRRRYPADSTAPKAAVIELYAHLQQWALDLFGSQSNRTASLLVLAEQARRIKELLETLPENRIGYLELERIVRTIYEPSPVQMAAPAENHLPYVHQAGAIAADTDAVLWWNCIYDNSVLPPDKWRPEERNWLQQSGVQPDHPARTGSRQLWQRQAPVRRATQRLILVAPDYSAGSETQPNLLMGDLEAVFGALDPITIRIDAAEGRRQLQQWFQLPLADVVTSRTAARTQPRLRIEKPALVPATIQETPSNLESLFYYPHQWFFRQKLRLIPVSLYSIASDQTLLGNLAHRFFELMLQEDTSDWTKAECNAWIQGNATSLLEREGATLLLYGREPERNTFIRKLQFAAWSLLTILRSNNWQVTATEMPLEGTFAGYHIRARADLVLQRGDERVIVDLKWSGARRRREMIRNMEDLQLSIYAHLLAENGPWPATAYFILEEGRMIARNNIAFREAQVAAPDALDHEAAAREILEKMQRTLHWRLAQIDAGLLELRTARTASELDEIYGAELLDLLEMRSENARWDDYGRLLGF